MSLDDDHMTNRMYVEAQHERDQASAYAEWMEQRELESSETMEALWAATMAVPKPPYLCSSIERARALHPSNYLDRCHNVDGYTPAWEHEW